MVSLTWVIAVRDKFLPCNIFITTMVGLLCGSCYWAEKGAIWRNRGGSCTTPGKWAQADVTIFKQIWKFNNNTDFSLSSTFSSQPNLRRKWKWKQAINTYCCGKKKVMVVESEKKKDMVALHHGAPLRSKSREREAMLLLVNHECNQLDLLSPHFFHITLNSFLITRQQALPFGHNCTKRG